MRSSINRGDRKLIHPLLAYSRASLAGYTALRIVVDERRYLPLELDVFVVELGAGAVLPKPEGLILEFALASPVTHRAVHRVI